MTSPNFSQLIATYQPAPSGAVDPPATGLLARWRADLGVTLTSSAVSTWADQSGNGRNLTQGTAGNRPTVTAGAINGHPAIAFTTDQFLENLSFNLSQPFSVVCVARPDTADTTWHVIVGDATGFTYTNFAWDAQYSGGGTTGSWTIYAGSTLNDTSYVSPGSWSWAIGNIDGSSSTIYQNGTLRASGDGGSLGTTGVYVSKLVDALGGFGGLIAEILIYDHVLSGTERTTLASYVSGQYAL
jgi:hypothetical protein